MKIQYFKYKIFILILGLTACKKKNIADFPKSANITVINGLTDVPNIKVNPSGNSIKWSITPNVPYGNKASYYAFSGAGTLSAVASTDTTKSLFSFPVTFKPKIYTLYVFGTAVVPDYLLNEETDFPFIKTDVTTPPISDHVVSVRFVNLSKGSPGLQIKIKDIPTPEVTNLVYKGISGWKVYANVEASTNYVLEIRSDPSALTPLLSYTFQATATNRFKSVALVLKGEYGTANFSISEINYF